MSPRTVRITSMLAAVAAVFALSNIPATAAEDPELPAKQNLGTVLVNSVATHQIVDGQVYQKDINPAVVNTLRTPAKDTVTSWSVKNGTIRVEDLSPELQALLRDLTARCHKR